MGLVFLLIDLSYLGVLIVLMMVMEMLIMAVFMIMFMMNPAGLMPMKMVHNARGAPLIAAGVFVLLVAGVFLTPWPRRRGSPPADPTHALGLSIMGPKMLVMMVVGVAILATMISTTVLATHRGRYDADSGGDDSGDDGGGGNGDGDGDGDNSGGGGNGGGGGAPTGHLSPPRALPSSPPPDLPSPSPAERARHRGDRPRLRHEEDR